MDAENKPHSTDVQTASEALRELGLNGVRDEATIRAAFRARVRHAAPVLHDGSDQNLRRLIAARDLLLQDTIPAPQDFAPPQALPLTITLDQALYGGIARIQVPALEYGAANVTSLMQVMDINLKIPAGLRDNVDAYLASPQGGHILCHIRIETEDNARIWGDDIWMVTDIDAHHLHFGGDVLIETPHGPQSVHLSANMLDGSSLRMPGLGLPATATAPAGDLIVRLHARAAQVSPAAFRQRWAS